MTRVTSGHRDANGLCKSVLLACRHPQEEDPVLALVIRAVEVYAWYIVAVLLAGSALALVAWFTAMVRGTWRRM